MINTVAIPIMIIAMHAASRFALAPPPNMLPRTGSRYPQINTPPPSATEIRGMHIVAYLVPYVPREPYVVSPDTIKILKN